MHAYCLMHNHFHLVLEMPNGKIFERTRMKQVIRFAGFVLFLITHVAMADEAGFYIKAEAGPSFLQDIRSQLGPDRFSLKSATGFRLDLMSGYQLSDYFAVEVNSGVVRNELETSIPTDYYQIPLMLNAVAGLPRGEKLKPNVGFGLGGVAVVTDNEGVENRSGFAFGLQTTAGIEYKISTVCSLECGYKFLYVEPVRLGTAELGPGYSHSVMLGIRFRF